MTPTQKDITNAMICYFFLGPLLWIAGRWGQKSDFSHPFVLGHARQSSLLFTLVLLVFGLYFFVARSILSFSVFGFLISDIVLLLLSTLIVVLLLYSALLAYRGQEATLGFSTHQLSTHLEVQDTDEWSDREKLLFALSFIPYLGIWIVRSPSIQDSLERGERAHSQVVITSLQQAETLGSWVMLLILMISTFTSSSALIALILTVYIFLAVIASVVLFSTDRLITLSWIRWIPTLEEINLLCLTLGKYLLELLYLIGGKESIRSPREILLSTPLRREVIDPPYLMPAWILAVPLVNIVALPSFFLGKYRPWRMVIIEGWILSILLISLLFWGLLRVDLVIGWLAFPLLVMLSALRQGVRTEVPIIGLTDRVLDWLLGGLLSSKRSVESMSGGRVETVYRYEDEQKE